MTEAANRIQELEAALDTTAKLLRDALDALQHCNEEKVELGRQVAELNGENEILNRDLSFSTGTRTGKP